MKTPEQIDASLARLPAAEVTRIVRGVLGKDWHADRIGGQCVLIRAGEQDDGTGYAPIVGDTWVASLLCAREEFSLGHPEATSAEWLSWFSVNGDES